MKPTRSAIKYFFDKPEKTLTRFWLKVQKTETCWLWTASKRNKGYGAFCWQENDKIVQGRAHVFSYRLHVGEIPNGLFVLHRCDNPACVRPDHLFLGTKAVNNQDMYDKGRANSWGHRSGTARDNAGEHHGMAKLTNEKVREIRRLKAETKASNRALAQRFGVSATTISLVVNRVGWRSVK